MVNNKGVVRFNKMLPFTLPMSSKHLREQVAALMNAEGRDFTSLDYVFCTDEYLLAINQRFLQHDDLTDIITFNLAEQSGDIVGEIYISVERVRDNSLLFNTAFEDELRRVIYHGALHLCGYKDKTKKDQFEMREKEDFYLKKFS